MTSRPHHRLTDEEWQATASGASTPEIVRALLRAQHSRHLLLAAGLFGRPGLRSPSIKVALEVLSAAQERNPEAVADLFRRSWFGVWVGQGLRVPGGTDIEARVGALAAVAAQTVGLDAETTSAVTSGYLHLPGRGRIATTMPDGTAARIEVIDDELTAYLPDGPVRMPSSWTTDAFRWQGLRMLRASGVVVTLDDTDPLRERLGSASARLSDADWRRWQDRFGEAWDLIEAHLPERLSQLRAGLHVAVPLAMGSERPGASVSSAQQCGSMALTEPADPAAFAAIMIHEWAHSELDALMTFRPLYDLAKDPPRYFAAWRPDPRPLGGVLHGLFAFLAVAETWAGLRAHPAWANRAITEFAVAREQLAVTLDALATPDQLTDSGVRFIGLVRDRVRALAAQSVGVEANRFAFDTVAAARRTWLRRHQLPDR